MLIDYKEAIQEAEDGVNQAYRHMKSKVLRYRFASCGLSPTLPLFFSNSEAISSWYSQEGQQSLWRIWYDYLMYEISTATRIMFRHECNRRIQAYGDKNWKRCRGYVASWRMFPAVSFFNALANITLSKQESSSCSISNKQSIFLLSHLFIDCMQHQVQVSVNIPVSDLYYNSVNKS